MESPEANVNKMEVFCVQQWDSGGYLNYANMFYKENLKKKIQDKHKINIPNPYIFFNTLRPE